MENTKQIVLYKTIIILLICLIFFISYLNFGKNPNKEKFTSQKSITNTDTKTSTGTVKKVLDKNQRKSLVLAQFKKDENFKIENIETDKVTAHLYLDCRDFVVKKQQTSFDMSSFLNKSFGEYKIDFSKSLDCKIDNGSICKRLEEIRGGTQIDLNDIITMVYGIYTKNFTYDEYQKIIGTKNRLHFPGGRERDGNEYLVDSEFFGLIVSGKINKTEDCINFLYSDKGNIQ